MSDLDDGLFQGAKGALGGGVKDLAISGQTDALRAAFADSSTDSSSLI